MNEHETHSGLAAGLIIGVAAAAAGGYLMAADKRKMRRAAHRFACGCEQAIGDMDRMICKCMR